MLFHLVTFKYILLLFVNLWSEMTKLIRVNCKQIEALRKKYPTLKEENDTTLVRVALENLIGVIT
jgi:hypothetical protein